MVRRGAGPTSQRGAARGALACSLTVALLVAAVASVFGCGTAEGPLAGATPFATASATPTEPAASAMPGTTSPAIPGATQTRPPSPSPSPSPALVRLVPIVSFWSGQRSIGRADLARLLGGSAISGKPAFATVAVTAPDAAALAQSLGVAMQPTVEILPSADVTAAVRASATTIGIVRAEEVTPDVRALAVDGVSLFGAGRVADLGRWPLAVPSATPSTFDAGSLWTLAAGGDVNLDRSVFISSVRRRKGIDYPWAGGTARIAGFTCCGHEGSTLVVARRTGNAGAFRSLLSGADLAIVNLEGPASKNYVYRQDGFLFSVDPALLAGLRNAGVDAVSLANNHIRNAGDEGIATTCSSLDALGVAHAGAGANLAAARKPAWLSAGGLKVAFLAYDAMEPGNWATSGRPGAAPLQLAAVVADIKAARAAGADFVIVMPHWGTEYTQYVSPVQRREAAAMVAAGADVILGSHSHYVGGIQTMAKPSGDPAFVVYSLGNLLFDFSYDEKTLEGVVDELTFDGTRLAQIDLHPTVMVDDAQTNLLDPAGSGKRVLDRIRAASTR